MAHPALHEVEEDALAHGGTVARLGVVTFFGDFSGPGLIQSEARLVLTGIRHDTVVAHAKAYAAQRPTTLQPPILRKRGLVAALRE